MLEAEKEIKKICDYLTRLDYAARTYHRVLVRVDKIIPKIPGEIRRSGLYPAKNILASIYCK